ncbi:NAD(P)/FAD-dependent oxidoreductase [Kutzneria sp. 744]|uniref:NAD(P)/FAD-dependent oxidoreductase n=1 Tax=Kutzneria sp. (strain 744) TaxID=345341 RepID=UPI0003EECE64|nr:NAD(P)/FAD-dependent oxidoreductase [Kutzneria sp. 744]EWM18404.1 NADH dehydrogenase [Kutzneria sp. 744]
MGTANRIVIVGGGFAGFHAAKALVKAVPEDTEVVLVNKTDYFLYLPLLPQVSAASLDPRRVAVSLTKTLPKVRLALGTADKLAVDRREVTYTDPEGGSHVLGYDRLLLAAGSVNKLLPIPGVGAHAHGFRGIGEALYLRDHVIRQIELAAATDDPALKAARCTFVVVGAGYTGTEVAAQGPPFTAAVAGRNRALQGQKIRWLLLDVAPKVLPELDPRLSKAADKLLRKRGVEVLMGTSVEEATAEGVRLTNGEFVRTRTLAWCVGVRPDPLTDATGLATERGRIVVDATMAVPGHPEIFACGDCAAVPDLTRPGELTAMTAQHAMRQGKLAGKNIAATLGHGQIAQYKHHDLGFVVDLGGLAAAANPLGIPLSGLPAAAVTRGYHLAAMPGNRTRTLIDWGVDAVFGRQTVQLGLVRGDDVPLDTERPA